MAVQLVSDEFWARVEPLLPKVARRHRYPGRKRIDDRYALEAIMYVLHTGCQGAMVPALETGCSGRTAWRRMDDWDRAGVWDRLHAKLLDEHNSMGEIEWTTGVIDAGSQRAVFGGSLLAPTPRTERRGASKSTR